MRQYLLGISLALTLTGSTWAGTLPRFPQIADNGGIALTVTNPYPLRTAASPP